jgi:hypothetical protein
VLIQFTFLGFTTSGTASYSRNSSNVATIVDEESNELDLEKKIIHIWAESMGEDVP